MKGARTPRSCDRLGAATDCACDNLGATEAGDNVVEGLGLDAKPTNVGDQRPVCRSDGAVAL